MRTPRVLDVMVAATTLHSADVIEVFLARAAAAGAARALILDLGSTDGTQDLVLSQRWQGFASLMQINDYSADDSSNLMLQEARRMNGPRWCLFCDPDEMPPLGLHRLAPAGEVSCLKLPRRNVTARRGDLDAGLRAPWSALTLAIAKPVTRAGEARRAAALDPPWIYGFIKNKILVRLADTEAIGSGDHSAVLRQGRSAASADLVLHHYPLRSFGAFATKVGTAADYLAANPQFGPDWGWHWRRWIRLAGEGALESEYLAQFPDSEKVASGLADGTLADIAPL